MKFALLYEIERASPGGRTSLYDGFAQALEQVKLADELGFHAVWSLEAALLDPVSVAAAPEVWLAAVAQHTQRIRIGHGVRLPPLDSHHPIRCAEMAAVLDILSEGRLELDTGHPPPASDRSLEAPVQWDEVLRMIPRMWTQEAFSWSSERFEIPPRNVLPKPVQRPHPPLWMSGSESDSAVLAGERGVGFMQRTTTTDPTGLDARVRAYREAIARAEPAGAFVHDQFAAFACMFCGEDDADAAARAGAAVSRVLDCQGQRRVPRGLAELVDRRAAIVGGPERCTESVRWYELQGVDQLILHVPVGSLAHEDVCDSLRRFGREVLPRFALS